MCVSLFVRRYGNIVWHWAYLFRAVSLIIIMVQLSVSHLTLIPSAQLFIIIFLSCVEITHVAKLINLPVATVERKLSQMILDRKFSGILDQGKGQLLVYEASEDDPTFTQGVEIIGNMGLVVEALFGRAKNITKASS